jgi:hypothetical protein
MLLNTTIRPSLAQVIVAELPIVKAGAMPLYPVIAQAARISGVVKIRVTTDGKKVASLDSENGPAMLVKAAKEIILTWTFEDHQPTSFVTTFEYRIEEPSQCGYSNGIVVLHLPAEVQVRANGLMTCDPSTTMATTITKKTSR